MIEDGRSLQKRSELVPERLMRGGLIVGVEQGIQGSLMSVTGAAIERITRERTEVPPQFKLPERPVYFLDPNTRRLIMISNRENRGENKSPDKYGLFAEIVELDEDGKPHYRLSSSEIILPDENYHLVAVGPNIYGLPPSHIDVIEEEEGGKKKFVPWNLWLGQLQTWMNEIHVNPDDDTKTFLDRFQTASKVSSLKARQVERFFPRGFQGLNERVVPINIILIDRLDDDDFSGLARECSRKAGLLPLVLPIGEIVKAAESLFKREGFALNDPALYSLNKLFPEIGILTQDLTGMAPAVITVNKAGLWKEDKLVKEDKRVRRNILPSDFISTLQRYNPIFAINDIYNEEATESYPAGYFEAKKEGNGRYRLPQFDEEQYCGLLNKLKADLLLTMFLRGGAPIVK